MAGPTDAEEQAMLNGVFNDPAYTPPATRYIALSTTTPADDGTNFTEPVGNAYARVATTAADWGAASGTAPAVKSNSVALTFPTATGSWGTITWFGIFDALTGGAPKWTGTLSVAKTVGVNDTPQFAIGQMVLELGDPGDTY